MQFQINANDFRVAATTLVLVHGEGVIDNMPSERMVMVLPSKTGESCELRLVPVVNRMDACKFVYYPNIHNFLVQADEDSYVDFNEGTDIRFRFPMLTLHDLMKVASTCNDEAKITISISDGCLDVESGKTSIKVPSIYANVINLC